MINTIRNVTLWLLVKFRLDPSHLLLQSILLVLHPPPITHNLQFYSMIHSFYT